MTTDIVKEQILKITQTLLRIKDEVEEIYKEGKRRAREKHQIKDANEAQKNFSIDRSEEDAINEDYH